jgi:hypothetical protein
MSAKKIVSVALLSLALMAARTTGAGAQPEPLCGLSGPCGDVDGSGTVASSDALRVLREAVGLEVDLVCSCEESGDLPCPPPPTGQTACSDTTGALVDCAGTGQDAEAAGGAGRRFTDNGDGTIRDEDTGLVWERLEDDGGIHDWNNLYTWEEAFGKVADLNAAAFAGHEDWRLPNRFELETLVNLGASSPATHSRFWRDCFLGCSDCSCTRSSFYWSSTTWHPDRRAAWCMSFTDGGTDLDLKATARHYVRAVR